ncbi:MAG: methylmalonyl-CoA epimerase [Verrucomicrobiales bacterium]|jgi:methylmalonyl-CoA/ethylmalonyl-CoA epimerase|nr:methylmalonyl-CoA epimerase [Verrucomicrobiales bacterium]
MLTKIDHLGIAVSSIEQSLPYYEKVLGLKCEKIETVGSQQVKTAFITIGEVHIELLEPTSPESTIAKFIEKNGGRGGLHHVAYYTDDLEGQLKQAADNGATLLNEKPFDGANNKRVAFLHPKSTGGVLTEFCTDKK